ncbi:hypothetical protein BB558_002248 [Smittium angustum]|uniref:Uncharacterized protein n=1 Tax=Smittium angustum TaxID=133377 RepID=A0A2U1J9C2_SMIAN|nr:hypothetical protein BB558_002248 [Smittium angustum]
MQKLLSLVILFFCFVVGTLGIQCAIPRTLKEKEIDYMEKMLLLNCNKKHCSLDFQLFNSISTCRIIRIQMLGCGLTQKDGRARNFLQGLTYRKNGAKNEFGCVTFVSQKLDSCTDMGEHPRTIFTNKLFFEGF